MNKQIKKALLLLTVMVCLNANMPEAPPVDVWKLIAERDAGRTEPMTPKNIYNYLIRNHIPCAEIVLRQILQETGHLRSWLCVKQNNLFGMLMPEHRKTMATAGWKGYARFTNWKQSVLDYKLWQEHQQAHGYDLTDYYKFLEKTLYAEDISYVQKLKQININQYLK